MDLSFFWIVLVIAAVVVLLFMLLSRARASQQLLDEQLATPSRAEDDPELRAEDTAQMLDADNRQRAQHGEPPISATEADVQVEREQAEADALPERLAEYARELDESLARDHIDPEKAGAKRSVDEAAHESAEQRLRSDS